MIIGGDFNLGSINRQSYVASSSSVLTQFMCKSLLDICTNYSLTQMLKNFVNSGAVDADRRHAAGSWDALLCHSIRRKDWAVSLKLVNVSCSP